ncbi:MAG: glycoside hydrolase family 13 protein [Clostridia bacterium]|nr:glycoside hydrolase family 13 protein [Clostridia bacterium]
MEFFDPKNRAYKSLRRALVQGESITLRLCMPREYRCESARLVVHADGEEETKLSMQWSGMNGDCHEWWSAEFKAQKAGLYWYYFEYSVPYSGGIIKKNKAGKAAIDEAGEKWQITVCQKDFKTPDWIKGGIIYQIFPDRFAIGDNGVSNPYSERIVRTDYDKDPYWEPVNGVYNCDYFGGNLQGICQKLPYLKELGVNCIYLNPIFEAHANHRYNTADFEKIDSMLGNESDFKALCKAAKKQGIHIILDGVFSHVGQDSKYFNMYRRYAGDGAYNSQSSPYYSWFKFYHWPQEYESWWGIKLLPEIKEDNPAFLDYICGQNGIARRWLRAGADGWRLDVADELPDVFLDRLRKAVKAEKEDALILGEVWEDATNKVSYSERRRYLLGKQLDCVMNYPFADAIIKFVREGGSEAFFEVVEEICANYPPQALHALMNHIGTHDTPRAITALAGEDSTGKGRQWQSVHSLTAAQFRKGVKRLKLASLLQFTLPGVPSIYYGDEIGMQGYSDPFNRRFFAWESMNEALLSWYKALGKMRRQSPVLAQGLFKRVPAPEDCVCYIRKFKGHEMLVAVNRSEQSVNIELPEEYEGSNASLGAAPQGCSLKLGAMEYSVIEL